MANTMVVSDAALDAIRKLLPKGLAGDAWARDSEIRAGLVALHRRYLDGDFDANMTPEMRNQLRIPEGRELGANHCELVVSSMSDRLAVTGITGDTDAATAWLQEIADWNRFDGLQVDLHDAVLTDGDTYLMVDWDNDNAQVRWTHEPAYDGIEGVIGIPLKRGSPDLACAVKIWHETGVTFADTLRVNVYLPGEIRRFVQRGAAGTGLEPYTEDGGEAVLRWVDKLGRALPVPIVHFANRRRAGFGISELSNVIGQQDQLNRTTHSIAMTTELSGFPIRWMKGWKPDAGIAPGMFLVIAPPKVNSDGSVAAVTEAQAKHLDAIEVGTFEQADITPLLSAYDKTKAELAETTRTPGAGGVSDDASGESRKQYEVGLLGKISRFHIKIGNDWENAAALSVVIHDAFASTKAPATSRWRAKWKSPALRNDNDVITQAVALEKLAGLRAALEHAAQVTGWDEDKIKELVEEREAKDAAALEQMVQLAPGFAGRTAARAQTPQMIAGQTATPAMAKSPPAGIAENEANANGPANG